MSTIQITPYFAIESGSTVTVMEDNYIVVLKGTVHITRAGGSVSRPAHSPARNMSIIKDPLNFGFKDVEANIAATSTARSQSTQSPNGSDMTSCMKDKIPKF